MTAIKTHLKKIDILVKPILSHSLSESKIMNALC